MAKRPQQAEVRHRRVEEELQGEEVLLDEEVHHLAVVLQQVELHLLLEEEEVKLEEVELQLPLVVEVHLQLEVVQYLLDEVVLLLQQDVVKHLLGRNQLKDKLSQQLEHRLRGNQPQDEDKLQQQEGLQQQEELQQQEVLHNKVQDVDEVNQLKDRNLQLLILW